MERWRRENTLNIVAAVLIALAAVASSAHL